MALIEPGDARPDRPRPRVLLDACASGPPVLEDGPPLVFSWLVWPGSAEAVLVLVNRDTEAAVRLGTVTLTELDDAPAARRPSTSRTQPPARTLGLYLDGSARPGPRSAATRGPAMHWHRASNLAKYLSLLRRDGRGRARVALRPARPPGARRPGRRGHRPGPTGSTSSAACWSARACSLWLELSFDGPAALPGLPPPDSAEAVRRGLVRLDGSGNADGAAYHPLHPEVREAMRRRVVEALTRSRTAPARGRRSAPRRRRDW